MRQMHRTAQSSGLPASRPDGVDQQRTGRKEMQKKKQRSQIKKKEVVKKKATEPITSNRRIR